MVGSSYEWGVEGALVPVWGQRSFLRLTTGEASERSGQDNSLLSERECLHMAKPVGWQWHVLTNRSADQGSAKLCSQWERSVGRQWRPARSPANIDLNLWRAQDGRHLSGQS